MTQTASKPTEPQAASVAGAGDSEAGIESGQLGKLALEFGPLLVFFLSNQFGTQLFGVDGHTKIFWATGLFMVATVIALTASRMLYGRIPMMPLVSGVFVCVFGGLTLWMQEELFIKLKPTIVNSLFAAILFVGLLNGRSLLKYLFGEVFQLREPGWRILTFRWACFFVFLAIVNEIVWRSFSTDFWAGFKLFGIMPITMIFAVSQIGLLQRYKDKPDAA